MSDRRKRRLEIRILEELYRLVKEDADYRNVTVTIYVTEAIVDKINERKSYRSISR